MQEHRQNVPDSIPKGQSALPAALNGLNKAIEFARAGRLISAIKHIEIANPTISREQAKMIVDLMGYGHQVRWPEEDKQSLRCL